MWHPESVPRWWRSPFNLGAVYGRDWNVAANLNAYGWMHFDRPNGQFADGHVEAGQGRRAVYDASGSRVLPISAWPFSDLLCRASPGNAYRQYKAYEDF